MYDMRGRPTGSDFTLPYNKRFGFHSGLSPNHITMPKMNPSMSVDSNIPLPSPLGFNNENMKKPFQPDQDPLWYYPGVENPDFIANPELSKFSPRNYGQYRNF